MVVNIQDIKVNNSPVLRVYRGSNLMYQKIEDSSGSIAKSIPDKNTVSYTDSPITLTNAMRVNGEIHLTGLKIQELSNLGYCINTSQLSTRTKIVIKDCILSSPGMPIFGYDYRHDWVIENNIFFGVRQPNPRTSWGRWGVRLNNPYSAIIQHNYFEDMGAVKLEYGTATDCLGYTIRLNYMKNVYQPDGLMNFINVKGTGQSIPNQLIEWNQVLNLPGECWVEDTVNIYTIKGTSSSPARIRDNFMDGAHKDPLATSYSGGGIILDGKGENNSLDCDEYWYIDNNQMIRQCNYQIGVALAINSKIRGNRCVVAAKFADGTSYKSWTSGIWTDDYSSGDNVTANIEVSGNTVGARNGSSGRMDYGYYPAGQTHTTSTNNTSLPEPLTRALEDNEYVIWNNKLSANNYIVGPIEQGSSYVEDGYVDNGYV